jgi:hypothetical protein
MAIDHGEPSRTARGIQATAAAIAASKNVST